jgi:predicted MFS family arabinose efflux permease
MLPTRYRVISLMMALGGVTYLDRACIAILTPDIKRDLGIDDVQMSYVFSVFTLTYALFEMPTAAWADRIGSRKVLTRIVVWWSAFTMLTAAAFNYSVMLAVRALFGVGEAGAWPNVGRIFSRWIPASERGRAPGIFFSMAHLAGGLTPPLAAWIGAMLGWRWVFVIFGMVGLVWSAAFYWWFRDEPRDHKSCSAEECDLIEKTRGIDEGYAKGQWAHLFTAPGLLPLCIQYFANTYGFYFFITWLPEYLRNARGMQAAELAIFSGLPLLMSAGADVLGGMTTDFLARRLGVRSGYRLAGGVAYALGAVIMAAGAAASDGRTAGFMIAIAGALSMFTLAPSWGTAIAVGGPNAGFMGAIMNTAGQIGGILSPIVLAQLVKRFGDWSLPLYVLAGLYAMASVCWLFIRPDGRAKVHE